MSIPDTAEEEEKDLGISGAVRAATSPRQKERPILFKAEMVRAILDGRKTQTRRIAKPKHDGGVITGPASEIGCAIEAFGGGAWNVPSRMECLLCPYGVAGDRLWVREKFRLNSTTVGVNVTYGDETYRHVGEKDLCGYDDIPDDNHFRSSLHMFRWASRITLEITEVKVERLQEITEDDASDEGAPVGYAHSMNHSSVEWYLDLWDSINGKGAWDKNPWVWVISFRSMTQGERLI